MNDNKKICMCGNKVSLNKKYIVCIVCSSRFNEAGQLLASRHNWNFKDYFCAFQKS